MAINVSNYSAPAGTRLIIPGHVSPAGGQTTHPSVVRFDEPWNGYRYWMSHTPYPGANDAHEDPNIVASHDGSNWEMPPGITNPLDNQPGSPGAYNSDSCLVYQASTDTMYLFWRTVDRSLASNQEKLYFRTSTDGVTWGDKTLAIQVSSPGPMQLISPLFIWDGDSWLLLTVNDTTQPRTLELRTSANATSWSSATAATLDPPPDEDLWHIGGFLGSAYGLTGEGIIGIGAFGASGTTGLPVKLRLMRSDDGSSWEVADNELVPQSGEWQNTLYQASLLPLVDTWGNIDFDVWYSGVLTGPPSIWNVLRTRADHINDVIPPTAPTGVSADEYEGLGRLVTWNAASDDRGVASYHIERDGEVVATVSGSDLSYVDISSDRDSVVNYRVAALDAAGNTAWSSVHAAPAIPVALPVPTPVFEPGTAIEVRVLGEGGTAGQAAAVAGYSISEDATPTDLLSSGGGVGVIQVEVLEDDDPASGSNLLQHQEFELFDPDAGVQRGTIDSLQAQDGGLTIQGYSGTLPMVARKTALAYSGPLSGAFYYYFAVGGVFDSISLDPSLATINVNLPPWNAVVWDQIRKLATIHGYEISNVAGVYVVRPVRQHRQIDFTHLIEEPVFDHGAGEAAEKVVIEYQRKWWDSDGLVYPDMNTPAPNWDMISLESGELYETNLPIPAYLTTVEQPVHVAYSSTDAPPTSSYSVIDKDGRPVYPYDWAGAGGYLNVEIGADGSSLDLTVRAAHIDTRAPFRIAFASADREYAWPALFIRGSGVFFEEREMSAYTGADPNIAPADSDVRINEPLISTDEEAARMLVEAALQRAGFYSEISVSATAVNRRGTLGVSMSMDFNDFAAEYPDETFEDFETLFPDETFAELDAEFTLEDRTRFENQAFGGIGGASTRFRDAYFRVVTANATPEGFDWTAVQDTLFGDFEEADVDEMTFEDFEELWPDQEWTAFDLAPLRVS